MRNSIINDIRVRLGCMCSDDLYSPLYEDNYFLSNEDNIENYEDEINLIDAELENLGFVNIETVDPGVTNNHEKNTTCMCQDILAPDYFVDYLIYN